MVSLSPLIVVDSIWPSIQNDLQTVVTAFVTLVGVALGAYGGWRIAQRSSRIERTLDMHRELTHDLMQPRVEAAKLVREHASLNYAEMNEQVGDEATPIWLVMNFYQRLWLCIRHKQVNRRLALALFGGTFTWWYHASFERQLMPTRWEARTNIAKLNEWIQKKASPEQLREWLDIVDMNVEVAQTTD